MNHVVPTQPLEKLRSGRALPRQHDGTGIQLADSHCLIPGTGQRVELRKQTRIEGRVTDHEGVQRTGGGFGLARPEVRQVQGRAGSRRETVVLDQVAPGSRVDERRERNEVERLVRQQHQGLDSGERFGDRANQAVVKIARQARCLALSGL